MTIYVHGISALPMLYESSANLPRSAATSLRGCTARVAEGSKEDLLLRRLGLRERPLHVCVDEAKKWKDSATISTHVLSTKIPRRSFLKLSDDVLLSSPELSFVQLAKDMDLIDAVHLGYELCGNYREGPDYLEGFTPVTPLTSSEKLAAYLSRANGIHGIGRASRACQWIVDGSRSPRETALSMWLGLPTRHGGWQFGEHVLNYELEVGGDVEGNFRRYIDIYWPHARVGLEYDSNAFHTGRERIRRDSVREKVIEQQGVRLLRVTNDELLNPLLRKLFIEVLAENLGIRLRNTSSEVQRRRDALAARLLTQKTLV